MQSTRRQFIRTGAPFAAAVILSPDLAFGGDKGLLRGGKFADGVISGDPAQNGITLWTRVDGVEKAGSVELEVATDKAFRTSSRASTSRPAPRRTTRSRRR